MSRKNRNKGFFGQNYWQSAAFNERCFYKNLTWLESLAINRFRWDGLPDTCDARFLEQSLLRNGMATICHEKAMPDVWLSLMANSQNSLDMYGNPTEWIAQGWNGETQFDVDATNGVLVFDSNSRVSNWNAFEIYARRLTHYERTEDINLTHQQTPWLLTAPQEKKMELVNVYKQILGGEPGILGNDSFRNDINVGVISTEVPFLGGELATAKQNVWNEIYSYLGIEHLFNFKQERMIQQEAEGNAAPTNVRLLDALQSRRKAAKELNERFGMEIEVVFNQDLESYNFNFENNVERMEEVSGDDMAND